ncbi:inorganic polyphosphate/ATP-NAD kinase [Parascardovia denticolens IPLA 20019]|uniref:NAD kinase n=1 Tax=Parascardovia denticolens TaxID=78258 RepID=UPI000266985B|nr:NAD kinase [Parascardovia denticolens]EIT87749.1 inorganic polyphosphate/ATP-NAD kinase [Parascardovia denticolens IPLA 20019]
MTKARSAIVVTHQRFALSSPIVSQVVEALRSYGFRVQVQASDTLYSFGQGVPTVDETTEIVVVLGGDGTILKAVELVKGTDVPVIGINLGHVGFLAEFESFEIETAMKRIAEKDYTIDDRMIADVELWEPDQSEPLKDWALNDMVIYHGPHSPMIQVGVTVDDVAVSSFGCDGLIVSTPTGSTAYAFSAGGPIVWPGVKALEMIPIAAHALFTRPLIIGSESTFGISVLETRQDDAVITCDGRRAHPVPVGSRVVVRQSKDTLHLARLSDARFTDRLVTKFNLPVVGWHEQAQKRLDSKNLDSRGKTSEERKMAENGSENDQAHNQAIVDALSEMTPRRDYRRTFATGKEDEC